MHRPCTCLTLGLAASLFFACDQGPSPEATSLLGEPLHPMELSPEVQADRESKLAEARARHEADPRSEDATIWLGRRLAYLGRYREAIDVYTEGLAHHPDSARLRRHRGHRQLTLRRLDDAIADLSEAARLVEGLPDEVEPDGLPNSRNIPTSTLQTNIHYHLGLAHYLKADWAAAERSYRRCLSLCKNDDMRCATLYWLLLTMMQADDKAGAYALITRVHGPMDIIENHGYRQLLLLFKGELQPEDVLGGDPAVGVAIEDATLAYGIACWHRFQGETDVAIALLERIVEGPAWPAFGHLAAEAELAAHRATAPEPT